MRKVVRLLTLALFAGAALIAVVGILASPARQRPAQATPDQLLAVEIAARPSAARAACRAFVERSLNDPGSAEWIDRTGWFTQEGPPDEFRVNVRLRAKNAFGALVLSGFRCRVRREGGDWRLVALDQTAP